MKNTVVILFLSFVSVCALALQPAERNSYYGNEFYSSVIHIQRDGNLKDALKNILKSGHVRSVSEADQIVPTCEGKSQCHSHTSIGYDAARRFLFGSFYLVKNSAGYGIQEMYCDRIYQGADFTNGQTPGPENIPDPRIVNVEHTWPQSRFSRKHPADTQKADLHHLFPTDSRMNALRGNTTFGEVVKSSQRENCSASKHGTPATGGQEIFEPPQNHKGHVARALFYFSVRYDIAISPTEETVLKKWNQEYPVDEVEIARNEAIFKLQGNRNPFIDYPEMISAIADF